MNDEQTAGFLRLPPEIRNVIYQYLRPRRSIRSIDLVLGNRLLGGVALLCVNKQLHFEFLPFVYDSLVFTRMGDLLTFFEVEGRERLFALVREVKITIDCCEKYEVARAVFERLGKIKDSGGNMTRLELSALHTNRPTCYRGEVVGNTKEAGCLYYMMGAPRVIDGLRTITGLNELRFRGWKLDDEGWCSRYLPLSMENHALAPARETVLETFHIVTNIKEPAPPKTRTGLDTICVSDEKQPSSQMEMGIGAFDAYLRARQTASLITTPDDFDDVKVLNNVQKATPGLA